MRIVRMYLNLVLWCHWLGCLWYFVGSVVGGIDCSLVPSGSFLRPTWHVRISSSPPPPLILMC